jgi:hypothetical protein
VKLVEKVEQKIEVVAVRVGVLQRRWYHVRRARTLFDHVAGAKKEHWKSSGKKHHPIRLIQGCFTAGCWYLRSLIGLLFVTPRCGWRRL